MKEQMIYTGEEETRFSIEVILCVSYDQRIQFTRLKQSKKKTYESCCLE